MPDDNVVYPKFSTEKVEPPPEVVKFTEHAMAKQFVDMAQDKVRYVIDTEQWLQWTGLYWEPDKKEETFQTIRDMNHKTARVLDPKGNVTVRKQMCSVRFAKNVETFAKSDPRIVLLAEDLDADPFLLGTPGGIIDLRTGLYREPNPNDYVTKLTAVAPADTADCPVFQKFLDDVTMGDKGLKRFLLQYAGYCLTGDVREQCLVFIYGEGSNGKTVFINTVLGVMGDYAKNAAIDAFMTTNIGKHTTDIAELMGMRCVAANETEKGHTLRMALVKEITGGGTLNARKMRQDNVAFKVRFKIILYGNHAPNIPSAGVAEKRRVRIVLFGRTFTAEEVDDQLPAKLEAEWPGVLRLFIDSCRDWYEHGLVVPSCVEEQTKNYFDTQDMFANWLEACCERGANLCAPSEGENGLLTSWRKYANEHHVDPGNHMDFRKDMEERGFTKEDRVPVGKSRYARGWRGVVLVKRQRSFSDENGPWVDGPGSYGDVPPYTDNPHDVQ
jgi:putative DNA primase/helicase